MTKQLQMDEGTAIKLYPTAAPEFKELLEQNFGKDFFNQKITDKIKDYNSVLKLSCLTEETDNIKVVGFNDQENEVVKTFIQKMRITKIYREGHVFKRGDKRWHPYYNVSSGFVFYIAFCACSFAFTGSASRLCFLNEEHVRDYDKKFRHIEEKLIDLQ